MSTYLLAGGCDRKYPAYGEELAAFIGLYLKSPKILNCFFSWPEAEMIHRYGQWESWFKAYFGTQVHHELAQKDTFLEQIRSHDVIYLHGGSTDLLMKSMPETSKLRMAFKNKIVIGSSAGANFLSTACYSVSKDRPMRTSGLLKVNVMVHYLVEEFEGRKLNREQWQGMEKRLNEFTDNDYETICLPEGKFVIFNHTP